jgi:hypothetical protein
MKYIIFGMGSKSSIALFEDNGLDFKQLREMWGLKQTTLKSAGRVLLDTTGILVDNVVPELGLERDDKRVEDDRQFIMQHLFTLNLRQKLDV